jgi:MinD superfamily P-loop ATPase
MGKRRYRYRGKPKLKEIVVISGKGGTGKTSIVASFAALAKDAVLADCDVDAADLHLLLAPDVKQTVDFSGGKLAFIITENCIGCPVIASIIGADLVLVVTEPTLSGRNDLGRVVELTKHFNIPTVICINKYDINPKITDQIKSAAREWNLQIAGEIAYDSAVTKAQIAARSIVEYSNGSLKGQIISLSESVLDILPESDK